MARLAFPLLRPCFAPASPLLRPCFAPASPLLRCFSLGAWLHQFPGRAHRYLQMRGSHRLPRRRAGHLRRCTHGCDLCPSVERGRVLLVWRRRGGTVLERDGHMTKRWTILYWILLQVFLASFLGRQMEKAWPFALSSTGPRRNAPVAPSWHRPQGRRDGTPTVPSICSGKRSQVQLKTNPTVTWWEIYSISCRNKHLFLVGTGLPGESGVWSPALAMQTAK